MFVAGEDCAITECTQAVNFTVYDEGVLINRMYFVNDSIATAVNILGGGALTKEYYLQYRDRFFNDTDCYRKNSTNSKITTVCGVKLTFPEFRYEYKNVTVK
jgi:hypothetical protein